MAQWVAACAADDIDPEDVVPFDHGGRSYAIYRAPDDAYYATDGLCTLRADSPEALEAKVRREEQTWASVRDFAANPAWRTPVTERAGQARGTQ